MTGTNAFGSGPLGDLETALLREAEVLLQAHNSGVGLAPLGGL
jgi:hypothetical protein